MQRLGLGLGAARRLGDEPAGRLQGPQRGRVRHVARRRPVPRRRLHGAREELALRARRRFGRPLRVAHVAAPPGPRKAAAPPLREAFLVHELVRAVAVAGGDELVFVRIFEAEAALGHALLSRALLALLGLSDSRHEPTVNCPGTCFPNSGAGLGVGQPANTLRCRARQSSASGATHANPSRHASRPLQAGRAWICSVSDIIEFCRACVCWIVGPCQAGEHLLQNSSYTAARPPRGRTATRTSSQAQITEHSPSTEPHRAAHSKSCEGHGIASVKTHGHGSRLRRRQRTKCNKRARAAGMRRRPRATAKDVRAAEIWCFPAGCFAAAMDALDQLGVLDALRDYLRDKDRPFLGICLACSSCSSSRRVPVEKE